MPIPFHSEETFRSLAKILWDYNKISQQPMRADLLLVMGTNDIGVAEYAAQLDRLFDYRYIVVTGGVYHNQSLHQKPFKGIEADILAQTMIDNGTDSAKIIFENKATNTGENITLTRELLQKKDVIIKTGQLVHTPTMQRRALATAERQWAGVQWFVSAQDVSYQEYLAGLNENKFIDGLVGDTFRILDYPLKGYQTTQAMPKQVKQALRHLVEVGFRKRIPDNFKPECITND